MKNGGGERLWEEGRHGGVDGHTSRETFSTLL